MQQLPSLGFLSKDDTLCLSITVTSRCNLRCTYCHYFAGVSTSHRNKDIADDVFEKYLRLIGWIKKNIHSKIQVRFSGGEPLVLGDRLYKLAEKVMSSLGENVHILTNGILLNSEVIRLASKCGISAFLVSIENPFDVDKGSVNPEIVLDKIIGLKSDFVAVLPAVVIVRNHAFAQLPELADFFFSKLGQVPAMCELNFKAYISPTTVELKQLRDGVESVVTKFLGKTPLVLFPYIVPELAYCYENRYLVEFAVGAGTYNFLSQSQEQCVAELSRYLKNAYPAGNCGKYFCPWHENCKRIKWAWSSKMTDYCAYKCAISEGYYAAIASIK